MTEIFDESNQDIDILINNLMKDNGTLSKYIPNYQERSYQIDAVKKITIALRDRKNFIFEGPTGFGKSPTYLASIILDIANSGRKAVIATAGIVLQEQLYNKDIPAVLSAINELTGQRIRYAYLKGRNNYLCKRKLDILKNLDKSQINTYVEKLMEWGSKTKTGDNSELDYTPNIDDWSEVSCVAPEDCEGKNCEYCSKCFYQTAKARAKEAELVVTNYHLLLSDMKADSSVLGPYDLLICDEAHEIAKIARDFTETKLSHNTIIDVQRKITHLKNKFRGKNYESLLLPIDMTILTGESLNFFTNIKNIANDAMNPNSDTLIIPKNIKIDSSEFKSAISSFSQKYLDPILVELEDEAQNIADASVIYSSVASIANTLMEMLIMLDNVEEHNFDNIVYWFERYKKDKDQIMIKSKLINVGDYISNLFLQPNRNYILTSATLSVDNNFSYIKNQLGLNNDTPIELIAESPFDMQNQQLWYLPEGAVEGNSKDFLETSKEEIIDIIEACGGGCLVLFTSNYNMDQCCYAARRKFRNLVIYKQGELPKQQILDNFKYDKDSVVFATRSFFTGIDVKGTSLRCVIIDKFPFESPNDPVQLMLNREDNAFFKYSIPDMVITLKQAVGRGVRDIEDKCVIAILDNRLATARYKHKINNSFNYVKTATRKLQDVRDYVRDYLKREDKKEHIFEEVDNNDIILNAFNEKYKDDSDIFPLISEEDIPF